MSADTVQQATANQVKNLEAKSGKTMEEWVVLAKQSGFQKHGEILNYLKTSFGLGHGNANLVVHYANQSHAGAASEPEDLITSQYAGKEALKPWYDYLLFEIGKFGNDIEISPKKAYVSIRRKKQFAIIQPSVKTRLDIGLNVHSADASSKIMVAGSWNSMCTHRVKIEALDQIDDLVISWLKKAYDQAG